MRLIDADALARTMDDYVTTHNALRDVERVDGVLIAQSFVDEQPTVDAVEVVRCGECKYFVQKQDNIGECSALLSGKFTGRYWFCADGERKEKEND